MQKTPQRLWQTWTQPLRQRLQTWNRKLPRQIRFTREGKYFFWITLGIGIAAINTGNNLLYLLLGMLLSLIIVSGLLSNISLKAIEVQRSFPSQLFADTPGLVTLTVTNHKRYLPSFSIEVEDRIDDLPKGKKCYFLKIPPGQKQKTAYRLHLPRRGLYTFPELRISTKFPFSFFIKSRIIRQPEELVVLPKITPVPLPQLIENQRNIGQKPQSQRGQGNHFLSLREMQPGDELRWIHWPSTARSGTFQVREFEKEHLPRIDLLLWAQTTSETPNELDDAIDWTASILVAYLKQHHPVHFATHQRQFPPIHQLQELHPILTHLALLSHQPNPQLALPHLEWLVLLPPQTPHPSFANPNRLLAIPPSQ